MNASVTIDLVTKTKDGGFVLILVEEGPWPSDTVQQHLRALQDRLHRTLDAVLGGHLLGRYPDSHGRPITLRVDAYDTPKAETEAFLARYAAYVRESPEVRDPVARSQHHPDILFEYQWASIAELEAARRAASPTLGSKLKAWFRRT